MSVNLTTERPDVPEVDASAAAETSVDATAEFIPDEDPSAGEPVVDAPTDESAGDAGAVEEVIEIGETN